MSNALAIATLNYLETRYGIKTAGVPDNSLNIAYHAVDETFATTN